MSRQPPSSVCSMIRVDGNGGGMGLIRGNAKKLAQQRDIDGLVELLVRSRDGRKGLAYSVDAIEEVCRFKQDALPLLYSAMEKSAPAVPAALARIGRPAVSGMETALVHGNALEQRDAALALFLMAARGVRFAGETLLVLRGVAAISHYFDVAVYTMCALAECRDEEGLPPTRPKSPSRAASQAVCDYAKLVANLTDPNPRFWSEVQGQAMIIAY